MAEAATAPGVVKVNAGLRPLLLLVGIAAAVGLRLVFARLGLEPHLGPLALVYTCLALLLSMSTWLLFFRV